MTQCHSVRGQLTRPVLSAGRGDTVSECQEPADTAGPVGREG